MFFSHLLVQKCKEAREWYCKKEKKNFWASIFFSFNPKLYFQAWLHFGVEILNILWVFFGVGKVWHDNTSQGAVSVTACFDYVLTSDLRQDSSILWRLFFFWSPWRRNCSTAEFKEPTMLVWKLLNLCSLLKYKICLISVVVVEPQPHPPFLHKPNPVLLLTWLHKLSSKAKESPSRKSRVTSSSSKPKGSEKWAGQHDGDM